MKHSWSFDGDVCISCGVTVTDWIMNKNPTCGSRIQKCCGKKGYDVWIVKEAQWSCSECGSAKSNDPHYLYGFDGNKISDNKGCSHEWKKYVGLNETFDYCSKCDEKRK